MTPTTTTSRRRIGRRAVVWVGALVLVASGLAVSTETTGAAATTSAPRCACRNVIVGETVRVAGSLGIRVSRRVHLEQRLPGGVWQRRVTVRSSPTGRYRFDVRVPSEASTFRVVAPAAKIAGSRFGAQVSRNLVIRPVAQTVAGSATAPVGQLPDARSDLRVPVSAVLRPARPGRPVTLQRSTGTGWTTIAAGRADASGRVLFLPAAGAATVRVAAPPFRGAGAAYGRPLTIRDWGAGDFVDTFDGTALDQAKWSYRQVGMRYGLRSKAHSDPSAVSVSGGAVHLKVQKVTPDRPSQGYTSGYANGHIGTQGKFAFTYGTAAARVRFSSRPGQHGAFWLQTTSPHGAALEADPARTGAEIDVIENYGAGRADGGSAHTVHWRGAGGKTLTVGGVLDTRRVLPAGQTWWNSWHVYSVEWTASQYVFRIDGHEVRRITQGVSGVPEFLVLSELSSDWELPKLDDAGLPTSVDVDWVRVWRPLSVGPDGARDLITTGP